VDLVTGLIIAVIGLVAGIFVGRQSAPNSRRIKELEQTIEENKSQHQFYKDDVAKHFSESADMFGDITEKYRSLYEHMSSGAYNLCDRRSIPRELTTSHVNILAVETPEVAPKLTDNGVPIIPENTAESISEKESTEDNKQKTDQQSQGAKEFIVDVTRSGLSPLCEESQIIAMQNKKDNNDTAEIIDLDSQRTEDEISASTQQAKDYAIKAKGVINHNSLNRDDVDT